MHDRQLELQDQPQDISYVSSPSYGRDQYSIACTCDPGYNTTIQPCKSILQFYFKRNQQDV